MTDWIADAALQVRQPFDVNTAAWRSGHALYALVCSPSPLRGDHRALAGLLLTFQRPNDTRGVR